MGPGVECGDANQLDCGRPASATGLGRGQSMGPRSPRLLHENFEKRSEDVSNDMSDVRVCC